MAWRGDATALWGVHSAADELGQLKLGYPSPVLLEDGQVLCAFWCRVNEVNEIRWVRLGLNHWDEAKEVEGRVRDGLSHLEASADGL
jgi:hypothetical protein